MILSNLPCRFQWCTWFHRLWSPIVQPRRWRHDKALSARHTAPNCRGQWREVPGSNLGCNQRLRNQDHICKILQRHKNEARFFLAKLSLQNWLKRGHFLHSTTGWQRHISSSCYQSIWAQSNSILLNFRSYDSIIALTYLVFNLSSI